MLEDIRITTGLVVLAALLGIAVWWLLPKQQVARLALKIRDPKARADVEDNYRKTVGQALGGAAVLIGTFSAYWQFSQQQRSSQEQFSRQERSSHDLLISNQVSKGFEQLGNKEEIVLRIGGIYVLEGVMNDAVQYHRPVVEALSAFIREKTSTDAGPAPARVPTDIQAALTVIGRRSAGPGAIDLTKANIAGARLTGATLNGAILNGVDLTDADLRITDLNGADLTPSDLNPSNLTRANLTSAYLTRAPVEPRSLEWRQPERCQPERRQPDRRQLNQGDHDQRHYDRRRLDPSHPDRRQARRRGSDRCDLKPGAIGRGLRIARVAHLANLKAMPAGNKPHVPFTLVDPFDG